MTDEYSLHPRIIDQLKHRLTMRVGFNDEFIPTWYFRPQLSLMDNAIYMELIKIFTEAAQNGWFIMREINNVNGYSVEFIMTKKCFAFCKLLML